MRSLVRALVDLAPLGQYDRHAEASYARARRLMHDLHPDGQPEPAALTPLQRRVLDDHDRAASEFTQRRQSRSAQPLAAAKNGRIATARGRSSARAAIPASSSTAVA